MNIPLQNISNKGKTIYLFTRESDGSQKRIEINSFQPFFFEPISNPNERTIYKAYDGTPVKRIYVSEPSDVPEMRSENSYSSDVKYVNVFLQHKVKSITPSKTKYFFWDIEIQTDEMPEATNAKCPVTSISVYNSYTKEVKNWYIEDMLGNSLKEKEQFLYTQFIGYIQQEKPDCLLAYNSSFDYDYMYYRFKNFAKDLSPIGMARMGENKDIFYPAGLSIVDYMRLFKKVYMREQSYALDKIAQKYLGEKAWVKTDFSKLDRLIQEKNKNDVIRLAKLEEKFGIFDYFNTVRRMVKCSFEDVYYNSRIVECILFEEAIKKNVVLPNRPDKEDNEEITFEGATRDSEIGLFHNISKCDLSSAYPLALYDFCLDSSNIVNPKDVNKCKEQVIEIDGIFFKQNKEALLPSGLHKFLLAKEKYKKLKKENPNDKHIATIYDSYKGIVNSYFGVCGNRYFRLYNNQVASSITYLIRDLLMYVKDKLEKEGLKVIYWDTDALFITTKEDISKRLNQYVKDWAKEKYGKNDTTLSFEWEGYFDSLFVLGSCHYVGYMSDGKKEIKGVEMKRSSSSRYEAKFQEELIDKVLNKESRENILQWVEKEKERIKTLPLKEIGFPFKINSTKYKVETIFCRAASNSKKLFKDFKINKGELFYFLFIKPCGYDDNKKPIDVVAFEEDIKDKSIVVDYEKVIDRAIITKTEKVFQAMSWYFPSNAFQSSLF